MRGESAGRRGAQPNGDKALTWQVQRACIIALIARAPLLQII
jgi:hypothetical protein